MSGLKAEGLQARSWNALVTSGSVPSRDEVLALVKEQDFDAVVVTRVLDTERDIEMRSGVTGAKIKRKESGFMKLFRYDYEEFHEPVELTVNTEVDLVTELYSLATDEMVWSTETRPPKSDNVAALVDGSAKVIVGKLRRSGKLDR